MRNDDTNSGLPKPKYSLGFKIVMVFLLLLIGLIAYGRIQSAESPTAAVLTALAIVALVIGRLRRAKRFHDDSTSADRTVGGRVIRALTPKEDPKKPRDA